LGQVPSAFRRSELLALAVAEAAHKNILTNDYHDISLSYTNSLENNMRHIPDEHGHDAYFLEEDRSPSPLLFGGRGGGRGPVGVPPGGRGGGRGRGGLPFGPGGFGPGGIGFGPFGPGGFGFRRGPRARRGDIRAGILALLQEEPRNGYQIMQELKQRSQADETAAPWEALGNAGGNGFLEMMALFHQLGAAAMQVVQAGNAAQIARAKKILGATRRSLYEILAEGSSEDA
jgi:hypothetical protein